MKKILAAILCLAAIFAFAGCGSQTEASKADEATKLIDLGGGLGQISLEGEAFGSYKKVEAPDELLFENTETTLYEDLNCDTPYIAVYRIKKNDFSLETWAQAEADAYSQGYYQLFDSNDMVDFGGAYLCCPYEFNGNYYYTDTQIFEDGNELVELSFYGKTEELQIGDTNVYARVPTGYTNIITQEDIDHGAVCWCQYSDDYYFPSMWIGKWEDSYEYMSWLWSDQYPNGLPITEEEFNEMIANWGEDSTIDYYEKMGAEVIFSSTTENEIYPFEGEYTVLAGISDAADLWFRIGDDYYSAWFSSKLNPKPAYADAFLKSLHTK